MEKEIKKILEKILIQKIELEIPKDHSLGDYAFPCFELAKKLKRNPVDIAKDLSEKIESSNFRTEAKGGYLNFFVDKSKSAKKVLNKILKKKDKYGSRNEKKNILIEFPGPNTNKPLHLGHVRNIVLGMSISNLFRFLGNKVKVVNLNNDRGIHISQAMVAYMNYGKNKNPNKKSDHFVGDYYVLYNKKLNKKLEEESKEVLRKWEEGDKKIREVWKKMNSWALNGFKETYKKFDLKFDKEYSESKYFDQGRKIIYDGIRKDKFDVDRYGAAYIYLGEELGNKVLLRPDGTSLYITQDLYLGELKFKDFPKTEVSIYVVGNEQNYHFKVLFELFRILKMKAANKSYHLSYGMVYLPEGRMKSREGKVVDADDLIEEMVDLAKNEIKKRYKEISTKELEKRAKIIGLGALRFFLLKFDPTRDILFNPEESISFEGDTGPYVQYGYARCNSILKKVKLGREFKFDLLNQKDFSLISNLGIFPEIVLKAKEEYKPSLVANYLIDLVKEFNEFYRDNPVLKAEDEVRNARIGIVSGVKQVLRNGLNLLGIKVPDVM
ncbi:MAG: arginine--tRNA ligase, partial [Nanoarchaeota archaeon]